MSEGVIVEFQDGVVKVTLNRPDKNNAIDGQIIDGLLHAQSWIKSEKSARVVVLEGAGESFCAGLDMANFGDQ